MYRILKQDSANLIKFLFYLNLSKILINIEIHITEV